MSTLHRTSWVRRVHVLAHNTAGNQHRIPAHGYGLLRPGGLLYAVDVDLSISRSVPPDSDVADLNDHYVRHLIDSGRDPAVGPKLGSLAASEGFGDVERFADITIASPFTMVAIRPPAWVAADAMIESGHATRDDVERWDQALTNYAATAESLNRARFISTFTIIARKPT